MRERFQFLNLSHPGAPMPTGPKVRSHESEDSVFFTIPLDPGDTEQKAESRDRDLRVCMKIGDELRAEGLDATPAARFKPRSAGTHIHVAAFDLVLMIATKRRVSALNCYAATFTQPHNPSYYQTTDWVRIRAAIESVLRRKLNANSLVWTTVDQLEDREIADDPASSASWVKC